MQRAHTSYAAATMANRQKKKKSTNNGKATGEKSSEPLRNASDYNLLHAPPPVLTKADKEKPEFLLSEVTTTDRKRHRRAEDHALQAGANKEGKVAKESASLACPLVRKSLSEADASGRTAQKSPKEVENATDFHLLHDPPAVLTKADKERLEYLLALQSEGATTDRKRHRQAEDQALPADANNNNTDKKGKVAKESASTQEASATKRKQRRSQELKQTSPIMVNGGSLACPLVRKSLSEADASGPTAQKSPKEVENASDFHLLHDPPAVLTKADKERLEYLLALQSEGATTDRKRHRQAEDQALQAGANKEGKVAKESASTQESSATKRKQRRSQELEQTSPIMVNGGSLACPLVRKSLLEAGASGPTAQKSPKTVENATDFHLLHDPPAVLTKADKERLQYLLAVQSEGATTDRKRHRQEADASGPEKRKSLRPEAAKSCPLPSKTDNAPESPVKIMAEDLKVGSATSNGGDDQLLTMETEAHKIDSIEEGRRVLEWLINPVEVNKFFANFWEHTVCVVKRKNTNFYRKLISMNMIDEILTRNRVEFTVNLDVTTYKDGKRETLNPEGRALPPVVWGFYSQGCSIRILNPSTYLVGLRQVCTLMQEFFHCLVGANVYLTPPNSQGFAPHYDDIEAFVLQVEGRKRWRLYEPPEKADQLSGNSSCNYDQEQLGEPILDEVLEAGDLLYFPRGTVHQAITEKGQHSLHITLSVYQQQAYSNLIETLMPIVLKKAVKQSVALRRGLPLHTFQVLGEAQKRTYCESRDKLVQNVQKLMVKHLMPQAEDIDKAVDQLAKKFQHEALPPIIRREENDRTVFGSRCIADKQGNSMPDYEFNMETSVRLLRANILRLVNEDEGSLKIYHHVDNALEYCKYEPNVMEILPEEAIAVELLISAYPYYLTVSQLPLESDDRKVEVATALWERGLLMTEKPFK